MARSTASLEILPANPVRKLDVAEQLTCKMKMKNKNIFIESVTGK
tara:strand:- start:226 stop:360 length:135 start_codon:yes stop_codon:yes gene_type:complete